MRELKFRYWNPYANKLVYNPIVFKEGWTLEEYFSDRGWTWEQYAGLKDKNGKEIYEGDILTVMGYGTYKVFWREWDSSFSLEPIDAVKEETRILMLCGDWEDDYGVIGNIHENPELLEEGKWTETK